MANPPFIYIVAGEASGDLLGARLIAALKTRTEGAVRFAGIGGENMRAQGMESLFPMRELSLIGIVEVLPHIPRLLRRWEETAEDIRRKQPDLVITIDVPGFAQRLMKLVRKRCHPRPILVHYVAPTVWAYRPKRAKHLQKLYDHLLVLLPFEPPYFEKEGLPTSFVGHPVVEGAVQGNALRFRAKHLVAENTRLIAMLPGSRRGEVTRHMPIFRDVSHLLASRTPHLAIVMPVPSHVRGEAEALAENWPLPLHFVDSTERHDAFATCEVALAKSGTVTLELALAKIAMVTMYKVSRLSAWLLDRMLLIRRFNLINILLNEEVVPELMQEDATPEKLAHALERLLNDPALRQAQVNRSQAALDLLGGGDSVLPSFRAADALLRLLAQPEPR